jgi:autotransporter-associated beta strand protein
MIHTDLSNTRRNSPVLSWFRKRLQTPVTCLLLGCFTLWSVQSSKAATLTWINGSATWDTTSPFWNPGPVVWNNAAFDTALFTGAPETITLGGPITAGGLTFNSNGYLLMGSTLTLGAGAGSLSPVIAVNGLGARATISSILAGSNGFTKTGIGTLFLTNNANAFSGDLSVKNGVLTITDVGQLGTGTTAISVTGVAQTGNPGYSGGTLLLAGSGTTFGTGLTLNREVTVSGRGTNVVNNTGGLVSVGNNNVAGGLTLGSAAGENRIWATHGATTVTGGVNLGVTGQAQIFQGNGNWIISGVVTGAENANDRFIKVGQVIGTTLWLQNSGNTFTDSIRVDSGTVRVATTGALGLNIGTQSIDIQNGSFELRTDAPGDFINKSVIQRSNTSGNVFLDHDLSGPLGIGTSMQSQTVTLGGFRTNVGSAQTATFAINSRNGYGASFTDPLGGVLAAGGGDGNATININANGLVTFNGSLLGVSSGTNRVLSIGGNGDSRVTGSITPGGAGRHIFVKGGTGTLTLNGTAGTMLGSTNVTGTVAVTGMGAFNSSGVGALQLNGGALDYRGTGEVSTQLVNLLGTTGAGIILANQPSGTGLVFNGNPIGAGGIGAKTLFLGGDSAASIINEIGGVINDSTSATSLAKVGGNTWLYDPSPSTYAAAVAVNSGATASGTGTNLITVASSAGIMVGQAVTGTNIPAGSVVVSISGNDIRLSNNIGTTAVAAGTALTFRASSNFTGNVTVSGGTLQARPTAGSGNGSDVINNASQLIFAADALRGNQWAGGTFEYQGSAAGGTLTEQLGALTATAGAGSVKVTANGGTPTLNFASLGTRTAGATLNLNPGPGTDITFTAAAGANGLLGGYATFGEAGTDFAASVLAAGTATALTGQLALPTSGATSTVNYQSTSTPGANLSAQSINSLKMSGPQTITLGGVLTITSGGLLFDNSTGAATIENNGTATNTLGAAAETIITINGSTPANALTVNARIGSGAASLTKAGTGTLIVGGDNTYTGSTTVNDGILQMAAGSTTASLGVPAAGSVFSLRQNGIFDINGAGANVAPYTGGTALNTLTIGALNGSGLITSSSATPSAISLGASGTTVATPVFSGVIQDGAGVVSVIKNGTSASVQALTGLNTYTGATIISGGSILLANSLANGAVSTMLTTTSGSDTATVASVAGLSVGQTIAANGNLPAGTTITAINGLTLTLSSNATGTAAASAAFGTAGSLGLSSNAAGNLVFNNGVLRYQGSNATVYQTTQTPSVTTDRLFTLAGNGTIQSSGQYGNSVLAGGTANNAALIFSNTGDLVFNVVDSARTLTLGGTSTGDNEMRVHLINNGTGALSLTKADAGLWILNPLTSNSYNGTTTVSGGILRVANKDDAVQGLSASSPLVLNGGVLETSGSFTRNLGAPVAGTGTTVQLPGGASGFSSATPGRLVVTIGGGDLTWGSTNFNPSSLVLGSGTALGETEITNNIAIGSAVRTISTINNGTTGTMITAGILSGVISGAGTGGNSIVKNGNGVLMLGNQNTYTGSTRVDAGNLIVTSIGTGTSSSLGASGALIYNGTGAADLNALNYVGQGETANRDLTLQGGSFTANRVYRMDSSGTGALVWNTGTFTHTTRGDSVARVLTLELRGSNTDNNQMNLVLANSTNATFANVLHVTKTDGGVWILNPATPNTFTGNINAVAGLLGLTSNGIGSAANIALNNGGIFAYGGPLVTSTPIVGNNSTAVFAGTNAFTLNGTVTKTAGANDWTISNNLEGGALLTFNGNFVNAETATATRTINIRGFGSTVWNGIIQNNSGTSLTGWNIAIANDASFTFGGTSANTYTGVTTLAQGNLILNKTLGIAQIGNGTSQFNFGGGVLTAQAGNLTGANALGNTVFLTGDPATIAGTNSIQFNGVLTNNGGNRTLFNDLSGGATLTLQGNVSLSNDATGRTLTLRGPGDTIINGIVQNGGAGAGGLAYSAAAGTLTLTAANTATGALTANRNTITINGANGAWAGSVAVNPLGTVTLDNSTVNANRLADAGAFTGQGGTLNLIGNASGTSETTGAMTLNSVQSYITMSGAGPNVLTFASVSFPNTGSSLNLSGVPDLGTTNQVKFTAAPTGSGLINGIMPRVFIGGGSDFAEYNASNGVQAFTGYVTDINTASATQTLNLTSNGNTTANRTVNAIKIDGAGLTIGGATLNRLTLSAAAIINRGGSNTLSTPQVNLGANVGFIQVANATTLTVDSVLYGTGGLAKVLPGTLLLNTANYISSTTNLLNGTTRLNVPLNALFPNQIFNINEGATLDLFGNTQYVGQLSDPGTMPDAGGHITTTTGTGTFVTNMAASTLYSGDINGSVHFGRVNGNTLTLNSAQPYTGRTTLMGGNTTLESDGTILNSTEIHLNGGALLLSNNTGLQTQNNNRIGDAIPIFMRDGTISYAGRISTAATETFGVITSAQGANTISIATGGGTITSADLTIAELVRSAGTTVNFTGTNLGQQGNNPRITFTTAPSIVSSGALGAWAIANSTDYAAYNTGNGVGIVGQGGFTGYDGTFGVGNLTELQATAHSVTTLAAGTTSTGLLKVSGAFNNNIAFTNSGDILNLELGGILRSNNSSSTSFGTTATRGIITSGTNELVIYSAATGTANFTGGSTTATSPVIAMTSTVGLTPGMTITNAGLPTGTYIVSVDSATQVTVSQNATATAGTQTFVGGANNVIVNSVIQGAGLNLVKSGAGVLNLSANNTYTGGTTVVQGTVNLIGSGVVIPAGGILLGGATMTMLTNAGQIDPTNSVTLRRGSILNLAGSLGNNNTLDSLIFDNNGGATTPAVNIPAGSILTLTNSTPVSVTTSNAPFTPTIAGGTLALSAGANTFNVGPIQLDGTTYTAIQPSLNITSAVNGSLSSLVKTGTGILQLSGQSTFNGLTLSTGGILISGNSTPTSGGAGLTSGPLGSGTVAAASGTTFLVDGSRSIANDITFAGTPNFESTANTAWTLTLSGNLGGAGLGATPTINVGNPFLTVSLLGNMGAMTNITKTGLGTLIFSSMNYTGDYDAAALGNGLAVSLLHDGIAPNKGNGVVETINLAGDVIFDATGTGTITVNRAGGSLPFNQAANKIISPASINTVLTNGLIVANTNGYGLQVADSGAIGSLVAFTVNTATASNVTQGLYMSGVLSGNGFVKTGPGTMVLGNATNSFTGNVNINNGVVSVSENGQLGNAANLVLLNPQTGTATLRATDSFTMSRTIQLSNTVNLRAIEVVGGETLTLTSAFDLNAGAGATASLIKADNGTLLVDASNTGWSGALNINAGAVLVNNNTLTSPLGTGTVFISPGAAVVGAALQLAGGVTINNPLNLQNTANRLDGGINFGGMLENVSGNNTYAGSIAAPWDATIGARAGSTLNLTGGIVYSGTHLLQFNSEAGANININTTPVTGAAWGLDKHGAGTMTISVATPNLTGGGFKVRKGLMILNGTGTSNSSGAPNLVIGGATLRLDNSGTNTNNRLTARAVTLQGGTFDFIANNSTETAGAFVSDQGANIINNGGAGTSALTFASYTGNAGSSLNITGTFGTAANFVKFTAVPALTPVTTGILNRVTVNGNELASYNATNGIVAFTGYSPATNILSAGATQTFNATPVTANSLTGNQTLNALTLSSGGGAVNVGGLSGLNPTTLTLTSGTILANGSGTTSTLSVPVVAFAATEAIIHVANGQTLNVTSGFSGTGGLSKNLPGILNLNAQQFISGATYVNGGTLNLQSGSTNTLLFNNAVAVNAGGTLDLNGGNQFIAGLSSASAGSSAGVNGGIVTNSAVTQSTLTVNSNTSFAGEISGNIYLNKTGTGSLNLQVPQTYTGATLITGGTVTLADFATLPNTTQPIDIRYGTLTLANSALTNHNNRVNDLAPINLSGGTLNYGGRAQMDTTESLGAVSLLQGNNNIFVDDGNAGLGSAVLTLASITQTDPTATLRFNNLGDFGLIGTRGRVMITTNPTMTNNIIGPWAIIDREYASYDATYGVGGLNAVGFAGYAGSGLNTSPLATDNVRHTATGTTVMTANAVVNTLNLNQTTSNMILDLGGNTLRLQGGGLLIGQNTDSTSVTINNGSITSGTVGSPSDFFVTHAPYDSDSRAAAINAVIADNAPVTGPVRLILSAGDTRPVASGLTLGGVNTYTGGTVLNQSTIILGATGALGTGGITVNAATLVQTTGGVIPAQALTMNGGSVVTFAGANSLTGLTFNNNGGAAPTLNPTGVLTLTGGITSNPTNPGTVSIISNGTLDLNGAGSYSINVAATLINSVDVAPWQAGLIINSAIQNGAIVKTGAGVLQLGGASTFAGGLTVNAGGLIIATDTNSLILNDPVTTGPVGTGTLTMAANTTMLAGGAARTITNNVTFLGDSVFNGTNNLTLNGITTLPSVWNATVTAPQMTVTIGDASPSLGTDVINKSGLGILTVGNYAGTINASGGLLFSDDGNTLGTPENVSLGGNLVITGDTAITVNRTGSGPNSRNKTLQKVDLTVPGNIMSVSNQSGYGLEFTGNTLMTGPSHFAVGIATASNVVQGLILSGVVDDGASTFGIIKSGPGALVLSGVNTFGGVGQTIDILNGVVSVNSDAALGNAANTVTLNVDGSTGVGFRSTGTFSTGRTFLLNQANNAFEVTAGNNLTLTAPFTLSAASNTLTKNDNGIFTINADNTGWTGAVTINAGALRAADPDALGSGTVTINSATNSALQLTGGITFASPIIAATNGASGFNSRGVIESVSGTNTISSLITQNSGVAATFGASGGATLNINGNIATANTTTFMAGASSTVNLNSVLGNGGAAGVLNKIGSGDLNVTVNQPAITGAINVNQGTVNVTGSGVTLGSTGLISINASGILEIDDSAGAASTHLGNRAVTIRGGEFIYTGNAANSAEVSTGALTFARMGGIFASNQTGAGTVSLTFASLALGTDATANFQGVNLGTATNRILFTTAPTLVGGAVAATNGILARATVNGSTFATYNTNGTAVNTNGIQAFTGYNFTSATNINSAAATDTVDANAAMTTKNLTATKTINALRLSGAVGQTVGGAAFNQLVLTSGGILATGAATHTLSVPVLNNAAVQNIFHVDSGSTLNVTSTLVGTAGLVKDGAGTLILSPTNLGGVSHNTLSGIVTVARGTLQLAGGTNTMTPNQFLVMGGPSATLDLNGTSQQILGLLTDTANPGSGGVITSSTGTGQLVINADNTARTWAGSVNGAVNLVRSGQNTLSFASDNAYTGTTIINGGTTTLRDDGALSGTSAISINYATLSLDNNAGFNGLENRVNDGAAITLRGGTINFQGRTQTASTETLGAVTLAAGNSFINSVVGGTGINSADLTLTSLTRAVGGGTINFTAATGGLIGSSSRILIPIINGVSTNTAFNALNDGILGGWAVIGTSDWASYVPGLGVGVLGQQGFAQYSNIVTTPTTLANSAATDNVNLNTASITSLVNDDVTINSLRFGNVATNTVNIAAGKTLTLESGGLLFFSTAAQNLGAVVNQGALTSSGPELFAYTQGTGPHNINSVIIGTNTLVKSGGNTLNLAGANTYTGGTTVNQGTLTVAATGSIPLATVPANGLVINNGVVTLNAAGAIASGNIVTMRSAGSTLNLFGNNLLEGIVINNMGGGSGNLQINTFSTATATGAGSTGVLTIGDAGIVVSSENISSANIIVGRTDFGATAKTVQVAPTTTHGVATSPLNSTLQLQGIVGTDGGIIKTGNGVLQFNAQAHYAGPTTVNAGGIRTGVTNGGSRLSALTLNGASTSFNIAGLNTTWGSLAGSGFVFSSGAAATLTVGFDDSSTTFSGQLARFNDAVINGVFLQKVGMGTMTMTSAQSYATGTTGTITVNGGALKYMDAGAAFPGTTGTGGSGGGTFTVNNGGLLALDNTGTSNVNNRLGLNAVGTLNLQGGKLTLNGTSTAATPTSELITTFNVTNGGGRVELTADAANQLTLTITTLSNANGNGSMVVGGIDGSAAGTAGKGVLVITTPALITGQGTGVNGTVTMGVRHDILGDASATGLGTGFLVRDSVGLTYRALAASELAAAIALPLTADVDSITTGNQAADDLNVGLVGVTQGLTVNSIANTLTISGTSTVNSGLGAAFGIYGPGGGLLGLTLSNAAASLTLAGATGNINVGNFGSTSAGTTIYAHVIAGGTLNVNSAIGVGNTGGLAKADGGTMNLNNRAYYTGTTTINNGTLSLNSGTINTLTVIPTTGAATVGQVSLNGTGSVLDLMGRNQAIGVLTSVNPLPGNGGTVQNTGAAATLTNIGTGTFSGSITGNISFTRAGNSTTTLTNANTYTGATVVRGGVLELRDSGTLASTAGLMLNYGTLNWNNFGLNAAGTPNPIRIAATNAVTLQGGTFTINGAGSTDTIATLNSVTVTGGSNFINTLPYINEGSTVKLTIGNLVRNVATKSGVVFNGFTTNNSTNGNNTLGGQGLTTNSNIFLTQVNGTAFSATNLVNNLIGGWAVADGSTFATYSNVFGVVAMGNVYGGFSAPTFTGTDLTSTVATGNYNEAGSGTTAITRTMTTGAKTANSWRIAQTGASTTITPVSGTTYSFGVGIITNNNQAVTIGAVDATNTLTGAGADLFFYINSNTTVVQPSIIGSAALISNGPATLSLRPQFASNTYSGGTFVNNGTTNLQAASGLIAIPGNLTITNGAVTMSTVPNQIAATSNVVINGGGSLTFPNYNNGPTQTLASLTFNNEGGAAVPTLSLGTPTVAVSTLILSGATPITSTNNSLATTPTISTGAATLTALQFSDPNPVIMVNSGLAETGLTISATITQNANMLSLSKSGAGVLALSGASSNFTTGFNLNQGGLMFGASSTGTVPTITAGPVGTGTLTIAGGTSLLSDGAIRTIGNATTVNGDFTFAGRVAGNGVILSGAMDLGATGTHHHGGEPRRDQHHQRCHQQHGDRNGPHKGRCWHPGPLQCHQ